MQRILEASLVLLLSSSFGCSADGNGSGPNSNGGGNNGGNGSSGSNNGGTGSQYVVGSNTGGSSTVLDIDASCANGVVPAELTRLNILFLLDKSGSMGDQKNATDPNVYDWQNAETRWNPVVSTLRAFFSDQSSTGIYASLSFLPADGDMANACKVASYEPPDTSSVKVTLSLLDTAGTQKFLAKLCDPTKPQASTCIAPTGGTPTRPALVGTFDYALRIQSQYPKSKVVVVFLTDGDPGFGYSNGSSTTGLMSCDDLPPTGCTPGACGCIDGSGPCTTRDEEIASVTAVIQNSGLPAQSIHIFGVGEQFVGGGTLDTWAQATGNAGIRLAPENGEDPATAAARIASTFAAELAKIRAVSLACTFPVPAGSADPNNVNIEYIDSSQKKTPMYLDANCSSTTQYGWQYSDSTKKTINLCARSCAMAQLDASGKVQVLLGCPTNPIL